jgi:hypothetical protein
MIGKRLSFIMLWLINALKFTHYHRLYFYLRSICHKEKPFIIPETQALVLSLNILKVIAKTSNLIDEMIHRLSRAIVHQLYLAK